MWYSLLLEELKQGLFNLLIFFNGIVFFFNCKQDFC